MVDPKTVICDDCLAHIGQPCLIGRMAHGGGTHRSRRIKAEARAHQAELRARQLRH